MRCDFWALNKCFFQMLPKLSVAGDLSCSSRQTVPDVPDDRQTMNA